MKKYKIGVSPINWRNDDMPKIGENNSLDKFFSEASQIGYDGVEMGAQYPREANQLKELLQPYKLSLASGWYDMGLLSRNAEEELSAMRSHLELLRAMGCNLVVVAETLGTTIHNKIDTGLSQRYLMSEDEWKVFTSRLEKLALLMQEENMPLSFHAHIGTVIENQEEIERMMQECPTVSLLYDTGHLKYAGADPLALFCKYKERINHIHLKDIRQDVVNRVLSQDISFLEGVITGTFTVPNDGSIDFDSILREIFESDYTGWFVVEAEQDPEKAPADIYAKQAYDYLTLALGKRKSA